MHILRVTGLTLRTRLRHFRLGHGVRDHFDLRALALKRRFSPTHVILLG
jgi:hypothetical protein